MQDLQCLQEEFNGCSVGTISRGDCGWRAPVTRWAPLMGIECASGQQLSKGEIKKRHTYCNCAPTVSHFGVAKSRLSLTTDSRMSTLAAISRVACLPW